MLWLWLACAQPENAAVSETPSTQEVLERESNNGPVTVVVRAQPAELKLGDPLQLELEVGLLLGLLQHGPKTWEA